MDGMNFTPLGEGKTKRKDKDPTAQLRRETRATWRECDTAITATRVPRNVIAYMRERGAFAEYEPLRLGGEHAGARRILVATGKLDWNPDAPPRAVAVVLYEYVDVYGHTKRGRGAWQRREMREIARVAVPHWDYDGVDPLVAREPWERTQAERELDHQAQWRRDDADNTWSMDWVHREIEAMEFLAAEGCAVDQSPADLIASLREGD